jgi:hypothetical protein
MWKYDHPAIIYFHPSNENVISLAQMLTAARKVRRKDIIQPLRAGKLNGWWLERYGDKTIVDKIILKRLEVRHSNEYKTIDTSCLILRKVPPDYEFDTHMKVLSYLTSGKIMIMVIGGDLFSDATRTMKLPSHETLEVSVWKPLDAVPTSNYKIGEFSSYFERLCIAEKALIEKLPVRCVERGKRELRLRTASQPIQLVGKEENVSGREE